MQIILSNSKRKNKRYTAILYDDSNKKVKTIHFGHPDYENYTIHKNKDRKERYIKRHQKEDWSDLKKAGTYSRYILWNKPTLKESISDFSKRFDIKVINKIK